MKTINQFIRVLFVCFVTALCFTACSPEDGTDGTNGIDGTNGANGETGPQGPQGETGQPGNANVKQYNFAAFDHTGSETVKEIPLTSAESETRMIHIFVSANNFWYPLPGYVTTSHSYRLFFRNNSNTTECFMNRLTGTGTQSFGGMRIFVIQSSSTVNAKNKNNDESVKFVKTDDGSFYTEEQLRQMSYEEFCKALNITAN